MPEIIVVADDQIANAIGLIGRGVESRRRVIVLNGLSVANMQVDAREDHVRARQTVDRSRLDAEIRRQIQQLLWHAAAAATAATGLLN